MKNYSNSPKVSLSTGDHKQAALYFDKLIPLHSAGEVPKELIEQFAFPTNPYRLPSPRDIGVVFSNITNAHRDRQREVSEGETDLYCQQERVWSQSTDRKTLQEFYDQLVKRWSSPVYLASYLVEHGKIRDKSILVPTFNSYADESNYFEKGNEPVVELVLTGLNLIDTEKVAWEQVLEIRKDTESKRRLRNLRLFIFDNYSGKSSDFIKDDLNRQIDLYELACKKHGFTLFTSSLSVLLDSKSLIATIGLGTVSTLLGIPISSITPAIIAESMLEIGKISINIAEKKKDLSIYRETHPLAYLLGLPIDNSD